MATITIDIPEQELTALTVKANAQGLTLEDWLRQVAVKEAAPADAAQSASFEEWERKFDAWIDSHDPNTPVLSDQEMSRENIYPDRS